MGHSDRSAYGEGKRPGLLPCALDPKALRQSVGDCCLIRCDTTDSNVLSTQTSAREIVAKPQTRRVTRRVHIGLAHGRVLDGSMATH
jgi:hypothetical protein